MHRDAHYAPSSLLAASAALVQAGSRTQDFNIGTRSCLVLKRDDDMLCFAKFAVGGSSFDFTADNYQSLTWSSTVLLSDGASFQVRDFSFDVCPQLLMQAGSVVDPLTVFTITLWTDVPGTGSVLAS